MDENRVGRQKGARPNAKAKTRTVPRRRPGEPQKKGKRQRQECREPLVDAHDEQGNRQGQGKRQERIRTWRESQRERRRQGAQGAMNPKLKIAAMWKLLRGASARDWAWLAKEELLTHIYVVDSERRAARYPFKGELPWPLLLTFTTRSRKHLFIGKKRLEYKYFAETGRRFLNSMSWAWFLKGAPESDFRPLLPRSPVNFGGDAPPEIRAFSSQVRSLLMNNMKAANKHIASTMSRSNTPEFARFAIQWASERNLELAQTDKDGVFCVIAIDVLCRWIREKLTGGS